ARCRSARQFAVNILVSDVRIEKRALRVSTEEAVVNLRRYVGITVAPTADKPDIKITGLRIVPCVSQSRRHQPSCTLVRSAMKCSPGSPFQCGFGYSEIDSTAHD